MQTVKQAVLATLSYFDLFGVPLTRGELSDYLLEGGMDEAKIDIYLKESPLIHFHEGYFSLNGTPEFWATWKKKQDLQKNYFKKVTRYRWWLSHSPFIELIAVCNTLPIGDVHPGSDIDLFVITKKNRLFLARWWLTAITSLLGIRRHGKKIAKRFCLSFYVSEEKLDLSEIALPIDPYLAYWIKTLEPLTGHYATYEKFLRSNDWTQKYFPHLKPRRRYFRAQKSFIKKIFEYFLDKEKYELETRNKQLSRIHQKARSLEDRSGTIVSDTMLKFHDHDARKEIEKAWRTKVASFTMGV
jgi:hypothetical protein